MRDPVDDALRVSWVTIAWSLVSGIGSLTVGIVTGALSLGGLGASVLIDVVSSVVLVWRFRRQRSHAVFPERAELRAQVVAAVGLAAIAVTLGIEGIRHLVDHAHPSTAVAAMLLAGINVLVLPLLARWKYAAAAGVGSRALRTDAHITMVGTGTAAMSLIALVLARALQWWWADATAALLIAVLAADQSRRSFSALGEPPG